MRLKFWQRDRPPARLGLYLGNHEIASVFAASHQPVQINAVRRKGELLEQLRQLADPAWQGAECLVVVGSGSYELVSIDRPAVPDDELALALPWAVQDLTRRPAAKLITDYFQMASQPSGHDKLNVVCSDSEQLQPVVDALQQLGLELTTISIEELALASQLTSDQPQALLFQVPGDDLLLLLVHEGKLHLARRLRGYQEIHSAPLEQWGAPLIDTLAVELQRSMDYFESQLRQPPVKEVVLALQLAEIGLFAEMLAASLIVPVQFWPLICGQGVPLSNNAERLACGALVLLRGAQP